MQPSASIPGEPQAERRPHAVSGNEPPASTRREIRLLGELCDALIAQRGAVARGDVAAVNGSVETVGRLLFTLEGARGRSERPASPMEPPEDAGRIEAAPPGITPAAPAPGSSDPRYWAQKVAREARINKAVLGQAMENGESLLQMLFCTVAGPAAGYANPSGSAKKSSPTGLLLNKVI
jgi:hypothetical protein